MNKDSRSLNSVICYFIDSANNKRYEFDITKTNMLYNYFFQNADKFKAGSEIIISNVREIPFEPNVISDFISYCQNLNIEINIANACQLNYLSKQFLIKGLEEQTEQYINANYSQLIMQKFLYNTEDMTPYIEEQLSIHLSEYIKEPQFKSLPFNLIHRIITGYNKKDTQTQKDIKDFLIDYLDEDHSTLILADLDFPFADKDYIIKYTDKYPQSIYTLAPKIAPIAFEIYKNSTADEIKKTAEIIKDREKDVYNKDTKTLRLSNKRTIVNVAEFRNRNDIETLEIPGSVKIIGNLAFNCCTSLKKVVIEIGCQIIGEKSFSDCKNLYEIEIPSSVTQIRSYAFSDCEKLKKIKLPNLKVISQNLFRCCSELKEIKIPDSVNTIEENAFYNTGINEIIIPNSVTSIGNGAFSSCKYLTHAELSNSITKISNGLFCRCNNLLNVNIPNHITIIDQYAFYECRSLPQISFPDSVKKIKGSAFAYCSSFSEITIPNSVEIIDGGAFVNCKNLKNAKLPKNLTPITGEFLDPGVNKELY